MKRYSGNEIIEISQQRAHDQGIDITADQLEWWIEKAEALCIWHGVSMDDEVWVDIGDNENHFLWEFSNPVNNAVSDYDRAMGIV